MSKLFSIVAIKYYFYIVVFPHLDAYYIFFKPCNHFIQHIIYSYGINEIFFAHCSNYTHTFVVVIAPVLVLYLKYFF